MHAFLSPPLISIVNFEFSFFNYGLLATLTSSSPFTLTFKDFYNTGTITLIRTNLIIISNNILFDSSTIINSDSLTLSGINIYGNSTFNTSSSISALSLSFFNGALTLASNLSISSNALFYLSGSINVYLNGNSTPIVIDQGIMTVVGATVNVILISDYAEGYLQPDGYKIGDQFEFMSFMNLNGSVTIGEIISTSLNIPLISIINTNSSFSIEITGCPTKFGNGRSCSPSSSYANSSSERVNSKSSSERVNSKSSSELSKHSVGSKKSINPNVIAISSLCYFISYYFFLETQFQI